MTEEEYYDQLASANLRMYISRKRIVIILTINLVLVLLKLLFNLFGVIFLALFSYERLFFLQHIIACIVQLTLIAITYKTNSRICAVIIALDALAATAIKDLFGGGVTLFWFLLLCINLFLVFCLFGYQKAKAGHKYIIANAPESIDTSNH